MHTNVNKHIHTLTHIHKYIQLQVRIHAHGFTYTHTCAHARTHIYTFKCMHTCTCARSLSLFFFLFPPSLSHSHTHTHAHTGANGEQSTPLYPSRTGCAPNGDISSYFSDGYRVAYGQWYFASSSSSSLARFCTRALSHSCSIFIVLPMALPTSQALFPPPTFLLPSFSPFPSLLCCYVQFSDNNTTPYVSHICVMYFSCMIHMYV